MPAARSLPRRHTSRCISGATPLSVRAAIARVPMGPDDVAVVNDPFAGGTHLPDVTVVAPVYERGGRRPFAYVANRAHHADIGGMSPGSMPLASDIFQEGLRLPPVKLVANGRLAGDVLAIFLANTRVPDERAGDLEAQWAALRVGGERLRALAARRGGVAVLAREMAALQRYSARAHARDAACPAARHLPRARRARRRRPRRRAARDRGGGAPRRRPRPHRLRRHGAADPRPVERESRRHAIRRAVRVHRARWRARSRPTRAWRSRSRSSRPRARW